MSLTHILKMTHKIFCKIKKTYKTTHESRCKLCVRSWNLEEACIMYTVLLEL